MPFVEDPDDVVSVEIPEPRIVSSWPPPPPAAKPCPKCDGTGWRFAGDAASPCEPCKATGVTPRARTARNNLSR